MGSPTSTRRRRNRGDIRDDCLSPVNSDPLFLLSASSDSETSESRRSSSRDLSTYVQQIKYRERRSSRDSSEERDQNGSSNSSSNKSSHRGRQNQPTRSSTNQTNHHHNTVQPTKSNSSSQNGRHVTAATTYAYADQSIDNISDSQIPEVIVTPPNGKPNTRRRKKKKKSDFESISDKRYQFVLCQWICRAHFYTTMLYSSQNVSVWMPQCLKKYTQPSLSCKSARTTSIRHYSPSTKSSKVFQGLCHGLIYPHVCVWVSRTPPPFISPLETRNTRWFSSTPPPPSTLLPSSTKYIIEPKKKEKKKKKKCCKISWSFLSLCLVLVPTVFFSLGFYRFYTFGQFLKWNTDGQTKSLKFMH